MQNGSSLIVRNKIYLKNSELDCSFDDFNPFNLRVVVRRVLVVIAVVVVIVVLIVLHSHSMQYVRLI